MDKKLRAVRQDCANRSRPSWKKMQPKKAARKLTDSAAAKSQRSPSGSNNAEDVRPKYGVDALEQLRRENMHSVPRHKKSKERGRDVDKRRRDTIATLYAIALFLRNDCTEWKKFCDKPYWDNAQKRPLPSKPEEALRHTIHYFHESNGDKKAQKQSSKHFKLLEPFFEQGTPRSKVRSALRSGVENLRRAASKQPIKGSKPCLQISISEKSFSKLKLGKTVRIRLEITAISDRWATAKVVKNDPRR